MLFCGMGISFAIITIFCQGVSEKDASPVLPYIKNQYKSHFADKSLRDVKNFVMLLCGIGISLP